MDILKQIFSPWLVAAFLGYFVAQLGKIVVYLFTHKKLGWREFFKSGGMPSSHSATVLALVTTIGLNDGSGSPGVGTPLFALALIFAIIVVYDATHVRRATGEQGEAINALIGDKKTQKPYFSRGHKPVEAIVGSILGVLIGIIVNIVLQG
ncbi:divergent PAP2 family protein [Candidatus Saccharibacteria bacterium]|nr:divergent PAP2 family protein [Candidatus Saccharibacteria bacterium]MCL1963137.1 divergent PAP2 family protein [Candidatus Saccharibacteria bacterium]